MVLDLDRLSILRQNRQECVGEDLAGLWRRALVEHGGVIWWSDLVKWMKGLWWAMLESFGEVCGRGLCEGEVWQAELGRLGREALVSTL